MAMLDMNTVSVYMSVFVCLFIPICACLQCVYFSVCVDVFLIYSKEAVLYILCYWSKEKYCRSTSEKIY